MPREGRLRPSFARTTTGDGGPVPSHRRRLLIFIVAYNAQRTIVEVIGRIPAALGRLVDVELLLIDDASEDETVARCRELDSPSRPRFPIRVLSNPVNQGYGGNQKIGYHYAIREGFDYVALLHGDGQYAPECLPELAAPLLRGEADAVFGSRMLTRGAALRGGMPLYKFAGNKVLTFLQNRLLRSRLSEFHSGYRLYSTAALRSIPFNLNSQGFPFDTEIIIQLMIAQRRILELPIPTFYGEEISHVNGMGYAWKILGQTLLARCQKLGILHDRKYDCAPEPAADRRVPQARREPSAAEHVALAAIPAGSRVLVFCDADGPLTSVLRSRGDRVTVVRTSAIAREADGPDRDVPGLATAPIGPDLAEHDHVLMLDFVEHLADPERVLGQLFHPRRYIPALTLLASAGNVGFIVTRLMLLFGHLNYGRRGILDRTHRRLFTRRSLTRLLHQAGFDVIARHGLPAPVALALGDTRVARGLTALNRLLLRLAPGLFAFETVIVAKSRPSLEYLLAAARDNPRSLPQRAGARLRAP